MHILTSGEARRVGHPAGGGEGGGSQFRVLSCRDVAVTSQDTACHLWLIAGPLKLHPHGHAYDFSQDAPIGTDNIFSHIVNLPPRASASDTRYLRHGGRLSSQNAVRRPRAASIIFIWCYSGCNLSVGYPHGG
jgi:hypothetical protein